MAVTGLREVGRKGLPLVSYQSACSDKQRRSDMQAMLHQVT